MCRNTLFHSLVIQLKIEEDKAPTLPALAEAPFCHEPNIYSWHQVALSCVPTLLERTDTP